MQNFRALGLARFRIPGLRAWGFVPKTAPPLQISGYAPGSPKGYALFVSSRPAPNSGQKIGLLSLTENLFFALHLILGKNRTEFGWTQFLILIFVLLRFSEVPGPPPPLFKILRTLQPEPK